MARQQWIDRTGTALALGLMLAGCSGFKDANAEEFHRRTEYVLQ